ncbi:hypothetical protein NQL31_004049 [Lotmaria passim]
MQEPSLEDMSAAPDVADVSHSAEHTSRQKLVVAAGVAAIGAYIGYTLVQSYRGETPQALWASASAKSNSSAASQAVPQIAVVNLHDDLRPIAREGLHGWLALHDEVELAFPTVMLVEEEETATFADVAGDVRRATLFAHKELREVQAKQQLAKTPPLQTLPPPRLCTVVYRSMTEVEGQPLEDWDVEAPALRRWHGKPFTQRHCLGFTVDGNTVTLLTHDVEGVLLTSRPSPIAPAAAKAVLHDGAALLQECGAPSTATFRRWLPSAASPATASASMMALDSSPSAAETKADALKLFVGTGRPASLWRGPFAVFSMLGTVLRYNRPELAVYPRLLTFTAVAPLGTVRKWPQRLSAAVLPRRGDVERAHQERCNLLCAAFLLLVKAADGSAAPSTEALKEVRGHTTQWVRQFAALTPEHETSLVEVQREEGGQWRLWVDLTRVRSTVVEAAWLMSHLVGLLVAVGLSLANVRLVAVPETAAKKASLLYPTTESQSAQHYWKPWKPSAPESSAVGGGTTGKLTTNTALEAATHPGWISFELHAERRTGFVIAQHDFATL